MDSLDRLLKLVVERSGLDEATIKRLMEEKKSRVGAGYLTDQGALFLVASDLGINLEPAYTTDLGLTDLYIGASEITVVGRIFTIHPPRTYRRQDGSEGAFRRLVLYDREAFAQLTLWDDKVHLVEELGLRPGDVVRVVKGYVRAGLDGTPTLHLGTRGTLEPVQDPDIMGAIPPLSGVVRDVGSVEKPEPHLAVVGRLSSPPRASEYVKRDGSPGRVTYFHLKSERQDRELRVVLWNGEHQEILEAPLNSRVRVIGVRGRLQPHGELELHGNEATVVEVLERPEGALPPRPEGPFRLLSLGRERVREGFVSGSALVADRAGRLYHLILREEALRRLQEIGVDHLFRCETRPLGEETLLCDRAESITPLGEAPGEEPPRIEALLTKIDQVKPDTRGPLIVEAIALSRPFLQDLTTRQGEPIRKAEVLVGDETGEIKVVAWREQVELLEGVKPGERLRLRGFVAKPDRDGAPTLNARSYSTIEKLGPPL
jgi:replication factor A1